MYMYNHLKAGLNVSKMEIGKASPNSLKALVITRSYILLVYHTIQPTLINLNIQESLEDFEKNGRGGALHNLLNTRQLSCLEEIYVDSALSNYLGLMDLEQYVSKSTNSASRLRYYGYINHDSMEDVYNCYKTALSNAKIDYALAEDERTFILSSTSTSNANWYAKHNLRPEIYALDSEKGTLSIWLRKVEAEVKKQQDLAIEQLNKQGIESAVKCLFQQDCANTEGLSLFLMLRKALTSRASKDEICSTVVSTIDAENNKLERVKISIESLREFVSKDLSSLGNKGKFLLSYYKSTDIFAKGTQLNLEKLVSYAKRYEGFLCLPTLLERICSSLAEVAMRGSNTDLRIIMYLVLDDFSLLDIDRDLLVITKGIRESNNCVNLYMSLLLGICGYTEESIKLVK